MVRVIGIFLVYDGISDIWIISRLFKSKRAISEVIDAEAVVVEEEE